MMILLEGHMRLINMTGNPINMEGNSRSPIDIILVGPLDFKTSPWMFWIAHRDEPRPLAGTRNFG